MEKDKSLKLIAVLALIFAVAGVSIGFAAFSKDLNINVNGNVNPEDKFNIQFSDANGALTVGAINQDATSTAGTVGTATISGDGSTIANVTATFKNPGDKVVFKFFVTNKSDYIAYLKNITFSKTTATCTKAGDAENVQNIDAVCAGMTMDISVGTNTASYTNSNVTGITAGNDIAAQVGTTYSSAPVTLTLTYGSTVNLDGPITVDFGSITLGYSTSNA